MDIPAKKWKEQHPPRRVLAIRLQAMGDLVITLPYLQQLRNALPEGARLDLLTREEVDAIPRNLQLFDRVYSIKGGRNWKKQWILVWLMLPGLLLRRYEVVVDLQNNIVSRLARKLLAPKAWSEFDRFSPLAAGDRTRLTIEAIGLGPCAMLTHFHQKNRNDTLQLLKSSGWNGTDELVLLNPAGAFPSRNWELSNYLSFARLWLGWRPATKFLILGTDLIASKAAWLKENLGAQLFNLTGMTSPVQAFSILSQVKFVLSEDSGLMHMAWVSGIPTLALFGSTCSDRAKPLGTHSAYLDSSDLSCGQCMLQDCPYGDPPCLKRYTPEKVFGIAEEMVRMS